MSAHPLDPAAPDASIGLTALARMAFEGVDQQPLFARLIERAEGGDAVALMDLATMLLLNSQTENGLNVQAQALAAQRIYRRPSPVAGGSPLRVLAIMTAGDMMANTPLDFLLAGADAELISLYVDASGALPDPLPGHDIAFLAIGESEANQPVLRALAPRLAAWPKPLLNADALKIASLTRDGACALLEGAEGLVAPAAARLDRSQMQALADGALAPADVLPGAAWPLIARPIGSHAGTGLLKLDAATAVAAYLAEQPAERFYLSPFIDYSGPDSLFRKHRIVVIEGRPFVCHMAVSPRWMVHYLNADMLENARNREEEARFFAEFDAFAARHAAAFQALHQRLGLDYFGIDSGETADGRLLVFEVDVAMIVHDMDPPDLFPYKKPQMRKVFDAFQAMLKRRAAV
ncbi:hypothetical protein [Phenylobacterium montanum]|uniref:Glutathione synthase n=1 Tax=Phenylobacterium montanum TaxID=2823693 RepID=A0A975FW18_9CAUL|nr:hypothetical protein [Caulobacter sp. S6]QUD86019.1 hypothetical protein KCG34_12970 [Caulobacter sp. S6]